MAAECSISLGVNVGNWTRGDFNSTENLIHSTPFSLVSYEAEIIDKLNVN